MPVAGLMERALLPAHDPRFDAFLYASVGEDRNELQVSVLSALARLGVDPWQEAKELAALSKDSARERLDTLIVGLTEVPSLTRDHRGIAERLIALLPRSSRTRMSNGTPAEVDDAAAGSRKMVTAVFVVLVLASQALVLARAPSAPLDGAGGPDAGSAAATR